MINTEYKKSISEVLEILEYTKKEDVDKISPKFLEFLHKNALTEYEPHLDHSKRIKEMGLNEKSIAILSIIASKYWLSGKDKENFENKLQENEQQYQKEIRKKYNPDNLFTDENSKQVSLGKEETNSGEMVKYKENFLTKIINKIKNIFHK